MAKSKLAEIKTKPTTVSVEDFINNIQDEQKRKDCFIILQMMEKATKEKAQLWSNSTIGFGYVRYKSQATGREVDWFRIGFAPRKANLSIQMPGSNTRFTEFLKKLGKHKAGVGCLYINRLEDVDVRVLEEIIQAAVKEK